MAAATMDMTALSGAAALLMLRHAFLRRHERLFVAYALNGQNRSDRPPADVGSMRADGRSQREHHEAQQEKNPSHRAARLTELGRQWKALLPAAMA